VLNDPADNDQSEEVADQTFGALLRRYRRAVGLTQEELAELSGLSARAIADIERGRTSRPYRSSVRALGDALNLSAEERELLTRAGKPRGADPQPVLRPGAAAQVRPTAATRTDHIPRQLPPAVAHFVGRGAEIDKLNNLIGTHPAATVVISAIAGTAGVGKTALAIHWAHQASDQFPDGQLYVDLRGYDPDRPMPAADALAGFLRTLGVPGQEIPDAMQERARLYRSKLAGRKVLLVLDNARDSEQVRRLLPGDPGCVALVTSRDALAGLVATDGARRLDLDLLSLADAIALLRSLIGPRADEDRAAAAELAALCVRLPLALRIAAEQAVARRTEPLAELVAELAVSRLDSLDAGEDRADVRAVFSWSVRQLPEDAAEAFTLLGLQPGGDLDVHAAAALAGTTTAQARKVLGRLHRASLIQASGTGRYGMHDLLRAYARERAAARHSDVSGEQALTRLFDYYLSAVTAAMDVLFPAEAYLRARVPPSAAAVPAMPSEAAARVWLDAERPNLVAVVQRASHGWTGHATRLAATLFRYLIDGCHLPEADAIYSHALYAARQSGDLAAEAEALNGLGGIGIMRGRFRDAAGHYHAALGRYRQCGDRAGEAKVLRNLGITELHLHNFSSAVSHLRMAVPAYEEAGDTLSVARTLVALAGAEIELDSHDAASQHLQRALPVFLAAKHQAGEAEALSRMGDLSFRRGQLTEAAALHEQALAIFRDIGRPDAVATEFCNLGGVSLRQGEHRQATSYLRQALELHRLTGDQHGEIMALRSLAEALHLAGQPADARAELAEALRLAAETGHTYQQASAHRDLAESHHLAGDHEQARLHWQQALTLYTQLGSPEADQIRSELAQAEESSGPTSAVELCQIDAHHAGQRLTDLAVSPLLQPGPIATGDLETSGSQS
jgi:tetratricopeptide (TPR) repeat protein